MQQPIIEVKNIGKRYNITHRHGGYVALRDVLMNVLKSPFTFLKTKTRQIAGMETKEDFWALKNINFTVNKGEVVGIIGSNGAGKSTLLKILSQITPPTTGEIRINGTVGSLLEVGTGFHPELTGRENIFLNGAILGMAKKEISEKFDAIVEFAGVERFLDTPVKYYSSGMYVRLAFSVAAHMEPDILIIDEVLAVGDAEFQKKCLGKMEEITKGEGRTILFVSHNMAAIQQMCKNVILLENGKITKSGDAMKISQQYIEKNYEDTKTSLEKQNAKHIKNVVIRNVNNEITNSFFIKDSFSIEVELFSDFFVENPALSIGINYLSGYRVTTLNTGIQQNKSWGFKGSKKITFYVNNIMINQGLYEVEVNLWNGNKEMEHVIGCIHIEIFPRDIYGTGVLPSKEQGNYLADVTINIE